MTTDLTRARLAVQNSHKYFTSALHICDGICGSATGRAVLAIFSGGGEMSKAAAYRGAEFRRSLGCNRTDIDIESVTLASKAQICLKEVFRVLDPHEHLIPEERMEDYKELKKIGVMQMAKVYNLMYGGSALTDGVSGKFLQLTDCHILAHFMVIKH